MAHNPPKPESLIENNPTFRAMGLVAYRYGELFTDDAREAITYIARRLRGGMPAQLAVEAFEARPMHERRYGRPLEDTVWGYEER